MADSSECLANAGVAAAFRGAPLEECSSALSHHVSLPDERHNVRSSIIFLIPAIALPGFNPLGHVRVQLRMV